MQALTGSTQILSITQKKYAATTNLSYESSKKLKRGVLHVGMKKNIHFQFFN